MFDIKSIRTDPKKDTEGVWVEPLPGLRLLIARMNNPKFKNELRRLTRPYRGKRLDDATDAKVLFECTAKAMAKHVLLGWEGLCEGGKEVEYSYENALRYLQEVDEFNTIVTDEAANMDYFRIVDEEESVKNSQKPSDGVSDGQKKTKTPSGGLVVEKAS